MVAEIYRYIYLKPLKTQLIKMLFFSFITKSHTLFMFKPASLSHENVKAKHERHCALRLNILVKNVKIVTFLFKSLSNLETLLGFDVKVQHLIKETRNFNME